MQKLKERIWRRDEGIKIRLRLVYVSFTCRLRLFYVTGYNLDKRRVSEDEVSVAVYSGRTTSKDLTDSSHEVTSAVSL